jgi:hypothetical protein
VVRGRAACARACAVPFLKCNLKFIRLVTTNTCRESAQIRQLHSNDKQFKKYFKKDITALAPDVFICSRRPGSSSTHSHLPDRLWTSRRIRVAPRTTAQHLSPAFPSTTWSACTRHDTKQSRNAQTPSCINQLPRRARDIPTPATKIGIKNATHCRVAHMV